MSRTTSGASRAATIGAAGLLAAGFFTFSAAGSQAEDITCFGKAVTVVGTDQDEFLSGTQGDDVMAALGGNDTMQSGPGNDALCGNGGDDQLFGETGTDLIDGGDGKDSCNYTDGDAQAEGEEQYVSCETAKTPRDSSPGEDPEPAPLIPGLP